MIITNVIPHHLRIPYDAGVASFKSRAHRSTAAIDIVLLVEVVDRCRADRAGAMGFAYVCPRALATAIDEMIAPQALGLDVPDAAGIPAFMERVQRNLHLFGRYGITMFAISALDIALWDLAAKAAGAPLHRLLGTRRRATVPAYASLLRIGDPDLGGEASAKRRCGAGLHRRSSCTRPTAPPVLSARARRSAPTRR